MNTVIAPPIAELFSNIRDVPLSRLRRALEVLETQDYDAYCIVSEFFDKVDATRPSRTYDKYDRQIETKYPEDYEDEA